jgi:hypothetical protein
MSFETLGIAAGMAIAAAIWIAAIVLAYRWARRGPAGSRRMAGVAFVGVAGVLVLAGGVAAAAGRGTAAPSPSPSPSGLVGSTITPQAYVAATLETFALVPVDAAEAKEWEARYKTPTNGVTSVVVRQLVVGGERTALVVAVDHETAMAAKRYLDGLLMSLQVSGSGPVEATVEKLPTIVVDMEGRSVRTWADRNLTLVVYGPMSMLTEELAGELIAANR